MASARTKVLLTKDVYKLGHVGDVVEVRPGFARNYLLPQRMAVEPTRQNLKHIEEAKARAAEERRMRMAAKNELAERINGLTLKLQARVNEQGRLFGSVGRREILQGVARQLGFAEMSQLDLPIDVVQLHDPIREPVTDLPVTLDIDESVSATVTISVEGIEGDENAPLVQHA